MNKAYGPYTPIRKVGELYFVSGQVGVDQATGRSANDVKTQTKQALENMQKVLETENLELNHVVKTTLYIVEMSDFEAINNIYQTFFDAPRPARSTIAVKELPRVGTSPLKIEIEAIAYRRGSK